MDNREKTVAVIGAGLVGALQACFLANRGYNVHVYEMRSDIRKQEVIKSRSINLALSARGRAALRALGPGVEERITATGIPMYARLIHDLDGARRPIPYGTREQYIMSLDRRYLNEQLISIAEDHPNVTFHFEHKLTTFSSDTGEMTFAKPDHSEVTAHADVICGCDGAFSAVRRVLMRSTRLDYSQEYIPHGYMELCIPSRDGQFAMEENFLHIWARNTFMMIALPNAKDKSFVVTLFMPFDFYQQISTPDDLLAFFSKYFQDSIELMGRDALVETFFASKPLPLVSVKCSPHHHGNRVLLLGDAAHAMVPFYGQGMNCGFEDCLVLNSLLDAYSDDFSKVLPEYTRERNEDAKAICDLAMRNYIEMRESVNSKMFLIRKKFDNAIHSVFPRSWVPLYTMVSFTRIKYQHCINNRKWQDEVVTKILCVTGLLFVLLIGFASFKLLMS